MEDGGHYPRPREQDHSHRDLRLQPELRRPMTDERHAWPYWSVDLPGLTEINANRLLAWTAQEDIALGGIAVDPAEAFSVHIWTVTRLSSPRASGVRTRRPRRGDRARRSSLLS